MRVQPFALLDLDYKDIAKLVLENGIITHGDPIALVPAVVYAISISYLIKNPCAGYSARYVQEYTKSEFVKNTDCYFAFRKLRDFLSANSKVWTDFSYFKEIEGGVEFLKYADKGYEKRWEDVCRELSSFIGGYDDSVAVARGGLS